MLQPIRYTRNLQEEWDPGIDAACQVRRGMRRGYRGGFRYGI